MRRGWLLTASLSVAAPSIGRADTPLDTPAAVELDREAPPPGRVEFGFDGGAPVTGWALGLQAGLLSRPIVLRTVDATFHPVEHRQTLTVGGALAVGTIVFDARWSAARQTGDRLAAIAMPRALDRLVPGDLRVGARARVVQAARGAAFVRGEVTLPTGDDHDFAGEPSWTASWSLIGRARWGAGIVTSAIVGIRLRGAEVALADRLVGDELFGGAGVAVPLPPIRPLWCDADQVKLTGEVVGILGNDVGRGRGPSPAEARVGVVTRPRPSWSVGVRAGVGLTDEIGAPGWRATIEVAYHGPGGIAAATPAGTGPRP